MRTKKNQEQGLSKIQIQIDGAKDLIHKAADAWGEASPLIYKAADLMDMASINAVKACGIITKAQKALEQPGLDQPAGLGLKCEAAELKALLDRIDSVFSGKR